MATYYIASSGNDANNGTSQATPWKTITKVNATTFSAGDSILFKGGDTFSGNLVITNSGTYGSRITVSSYGTGQATINPGNGTGIQIKDANYVTVSNLTVTGPGVTLTGSTSSTTSTSPGVEVISTTTQATVTSWYQSVYLDNLTVSGCNWGIDYHSHGGGATTPFPVGYNDIRITNCTVHDCAANGILVRSNTTASGNYVGLQGGQQLYHKNVYIANCIVYNIYGDSSVTAQWTGSGIVVSNTQSGTTERCLVYNCGAASGSTANGGPVANWIYACDSYVIQYCESHHQHDGANGDAGGFDIDGGCTNCIIQYCYSHDNDGTAFLTATFGANGGQAASGPVTNCVFRYNISQNDGRLHNSACARRYAGAGEPGVTWHNNLFYCDTPGSSPNLIMDIGGTNQAFYNNIFWCGAGITILQGVSNAAFIGNLYWFGGGAFFLSYNGINYTSLAGFRAVQETLHSADTGVFADPQLNSPGTGGNVMPTNLLNSLTAYDPLHGSPVIDAAIDLLSAFGINPGPVDFHGNPIRKGNDYDIGPVEYNAGSLLSATSSGEYFIDL